MLWLLAGLLGLILVALLVASLVYSPQYVYRVLVWQESDYGDYMNNFPQRTLHASPEPSIFDSAPNEDRVRAVFELDLQNSQG